MQRLYIALLFCLAITLHNLEEALYLPQWTTTVSLPLHLQPKPFYIVVSIITLLAYIITALMLCYPNKPRYRFLFIGYAGAMWINAFVPHMIISIMTRTMMPGVITAILFVLPICTFILYKLARSWKEIVASTGVVGLFLLGVVFLQLFL